MKLLIVIDMQNDFLTGALRNEEGIKIIPGVIKKIEEYKQNGDLIIATRDTHFEHYLNTQEGKNLPVVHCVKGTKGWEIEDSIKEALDEVKIFDKLTFGSKELGFYLKEHYETIQANLEIELVGVCTDICVISNAMIVKANLPEAKIIVNSSLCAGVTIESHNTALKAMAMCQIEIR
jgi:nicotinamidase-related amidase